MPEKVADCFIVSTILANSQLLKTWKVYAVPIINCELLVYVTSSKNTLKSRECELKRKQISRMSFCKKKSESTTVLRGKQISTLKKHWINLSFSRKSGTFKINQQSEWSKLLMKWS